MPVRTTVSNSDAGDLRFAITLSNRPIFGRDMFVDVFIDTVTAPAALFDGPGGGNLTVKGFSTDTTVG